MFLLLMLDSSTENHKNYYTLPQASLSLFKSSQESSNSQNTAIRLNHLLAQFKYKDFFIK